MKKYLGAITVLWVVATPVYAGIEINEVMYSADKGGEWVEIVNTGSTPIDIKGWKLFDGSNHTITTVSFIVAPNEYIVLANDKNDFLSTFNTHSGRVLDIVTALNNDGDTVILRNASSVDIHSMKYTGDAGADKNGKSLQRIGAEFYPFRPASPGEATIATLQDIEDQKSADTTQTTNTQTQDVVSSDPTLRSPYHAWPSDMNLYVTAGGDRITLSGARTIFEGRVLSASKKPLPNADLIWTFGDGGSDRGTKVSHTFHYPGKYVVILDVISGDYIAKDQIIVDVIPPSIEITEIVQGEDGYIKVTNNTSHNIDIGEYVLEAGGIMGSHFTMPKNSILLTGRSVILPNKVTRLRVESDAVSLKFPGGDSITTFATSTSEVVEKVELNTSALVEGVQLEEEQEKPTTLSRIHEYFSETVLPSVFSMNTDMSQEADSTSRDSTIVQEDIFGTSSIAQTASAGLLKSFDASRYAPLATLIIGAVAFVFVLSRHDRKSSKAEDADDYEIIE